MIEAGTDAQAVARRIAFGANLSREVVSAAPILAALAQPMPRLDLIVRLGRLKTVYGMGERTEAEWEEFFATYADALADLPPEAVEDAILEWNRKGNSRFPAPADLYRLGTKAAGPIRTAAYRAKIAAELVARGEKAKARHDETEQEKVRAMVDEMRGPDGRISLKPKTIPAPPESGYETPQEMAAAVRRLADEDPEPVE